MRIQNSIIAANATRQREINSQKNTKSIKKLSSGLKINQAADDAAGLAISEKMRAQIRGMDMASKNCQDAISLVQTAEGGLQTSHDILQRMHELAVQAASDTNDNELDRAALDDEYQSLLKEINGTANSTQFNGINLLDGTLAGEGVQNVMINVGKGLSFDVQVLNDSLPVGNYIVTFEANNGGTDVLIEVKSTDGVLYNTWNGQISALSAGEGAGISWPNQLNIEFYTSEDVQTGDDWVEQISLASFTVGEGGLIIQTGANAGDELEISIDRMDGFGLGIDPSSVADLASASTSIDKVTGAINKISMQRGELGAIQNRLQYKTDSLNINSENLQTAESRIRDLDFAKEMTDFNKSSILTQSATAMLSQANTLPQGVLQLLG